MGFHACPYCHVDDGFFDLRSSGDITMEFESGRTWQMPDMIIHYIADHGWQPPPEFVEDVMSLKLVDGNRAQTRGTDSPTKVGYLSDQFDYGPVSSWELVGKLAALMNKATRLGSRRQTRAG